MSASALLINEEDCERGGKLGSDEEGIENDFAYRNNVSNATKSVRLAFVRKVYGLLSVQLLMTVVVVGICMFTPHAQEFIRENDWLMFTSMILSIVLLIALHFKRKESPTNLVLLAAFTLVQAYTIGVIVTFFSKVVVLEALVITLAVFGGLTLFTLQTKKDFSFLGFGLFAALLALIVGGFVQIFVQSSILELVIAVGGAVVFSLFILFDTQLIMQQLSAEEYILATINLYLDIVNLFLYILRILQAVNRQ